MRFDVRRVAAVDMYGAAGTRLRRRIILAEFLLGVVVCGGVGGWVVATASTGGWRGFGIWLIGVGLNYLPLAGYAISFSRAGRLEAELAGVDVHGELRYYTVAQLWLFVPGLLLVLAVRQRFAAARSG